MLYRNHHNKHNSDKDIDIVMYDDADVDMPDEEDDMFVDTVSSSTHMCRCAECVSVFY